MSEDKLSMCGAFGFIGSSVFAGFGLIVPAMLSFGVFAYTMMRFGVDK